MAAVTALLGRVRTSVFLKDTAILTSGTVLAQAINLMTVPVLSRLYAPEQFGRVAVFSAVAAISATFVTLRYELAVMLPREDDASNRVAALCIALTVCLGVPLGLLVWLMPRSLGAAIGLTAIGGWLPIAVAAGIGSAVLTVGSTWLNRRRRYWAMSALRVVQVVIAAAIGVAYGVLGRADGLLLAQLAAILCVALASLWQMRAVFGNLASRSLVEAAREHRSSPTHLLPTALLDVASMQLPVLLITAWFGSDDSGQFSMAWRIMWLPIAMIGAAVGQVFYQRFSQMRGDPGGARRMLLDIWKLLLVIGGIPTLLVLAFGEPLFAWAFGNAWREAGAIASIIAPMLLALLVVGPTSSAMIALGLQRYLLWFGIAAFCYRPLCLWIGYSLGSLHTGLLIYTITEVIQIGIFQLVVLRGLKER